MINYSCTNNRLIRGIYKFFHCVRDKNKLSMSDKNIRDLSCVVYMGFVCGFGHPYCCFNIYPWGFRIEYTDFQGVPGYRDYFYFEGDVRSQSTKHYIIYRCYRKGRTMWIPCTKDPDLFALYNELDKKKRSWYE